MKEILCLFFVLPSLVVFGQTAPAEKQITTYTQSWLSINSTVRITDHWGVVGDFHIRRDDVIAKDYFYFLRAGVTYWVATKYPVTAGVAHLWLAPTNGNTMWSNENRIYQQWSGVISQNRLSILNRLRLEQRWRDVIVNDEVVGDKLFSFRLRCLVSFDVKVFEDPRRPSLVISDEVLVQFGEDIVYNTFDQNRLFLGLKIPFSKKLSADVGYMNILQQKSSGFRYDLSHVFRLFFYYNLDLSKNKNRIIHQEETE